MQAQGEGGPSHSYVMCNDCYLKAIDGLELELGEGFGEGLGGGLEFGLGVLLILDPSTPLLSP